MKLKKLVAWLLCISMMLSVAQINTFAQEDSYVEAAETGDESLSSPESVDNDGRDEAADRKITIEKKETSETMEAAAELMSAVVASGTCGDNLTWTLDSEGTLTIEGSGAMTNYSSYSSIPWYSGAFNEYDK